MDLPEDLLENVSEGLPEIDEQIAESQGTFLQLDNLGQLFNDASTNTTRSFPRDSLLSRSFDRPDSGASTTRTEDDEERRPSWFSASSPDG